MKNKKIVAKAIGMGAAAGLRGLVAPTIAGYFLNYGADNLLNKSKFGVGKSLANTVITKVLSRGDQNTKLPLNPNHKLITRNSLGKIASGAMAGAGIYRANKGGAFKGLVLGGASALAVTVASHYLQKYLHKKSNSGDPMLKAFGLLLSAGQHLLKK
ncbi:MAG: hypothetical protein EOP42_07520 [Sphingobacteriaceae bacterium]|nr:MAG: hypothetical protein EOP42_07520 [Sphingobacteriaceae bacterium]